MSETSKLTAANNKKSLRTVIPISILKKLELNEGDFIDWDLDKDGDCWIVVVRKK